MGWKEIMGVNDPKNSFANIANTFQEKKNKKSIENDNNKERKKVQNDNYSGYPQYPQKPKTKIVCSDFYSQYSQNPKNITLDGFDCRSCKYQAAYSERDVRCAYELLTTGKPVKPQNYYNCPLIEQ